MLERLYIRNIALIEETELLLEEGLTVVTGETGAGKSMLMDALGLALGERAESMLLREGAKEGVVEACFALDDEAHLMRHTLEEQGISLEDGELILRRILQEGGKSRAFANGVRLTQQQLQNVGERLADIHGQHDHQLLLRPHRHAEMLDRFGNLREERQNVLTAWEKWQDLRDRLNEAESRLADQEREKTLLTSFVGELENLNYNPGEEEHLSAERTRLMAGEQVIIALQQVVQGLGSDTLSHVLNQVGKAVDEAVHKGGESLQPLSTRLEGVRLEIEEIIRDAESLVSQSEPDPVMLEQVDNRLAGLKDIARKHRVDIQELAVLRQKFSEQLAELELLEDGLDDLAKHEKLAWQAYEVAAKDLSLKRKSVATALVRAVEEALADLKMEATRFHCHFEELPQERWGAGGCEQVRFLIASNPSATPQPLDKVASGGEISRLMLALKEVFFAAMPPMTLVFDEIDTGIGGAVADAVGDALASLADVHQVVVITHQPQVAAKGEMHVQIQKQTEGGRTRTTVVTLDDVRRQEELARMLSGREVTEAAREAAASLLGAA